MDYASINPGLKIDVRQAFTITMLGCVFFVSHNEMTDDIEWNMFMDDSITKEKVEKVLRSYLTNR